MFCNQHRMYYQLHHLSVENTDYFNTALYSIFPFHGVMQKKFYFYNKRSHIFFIAD